MILSINLRSSMNSKLLNQKVKKKIRPDFKINKNKHIQYFVNFLNI